MADLKISAMTQPGFVMNGDLMPLVIDATGNFFLNAIPGGLLGLQGNGGGIGIDSAGGIGLIPAAGQIVAIGYTPGNAGDWAPPPVDYQGAIDRIAAKLASIFGPIP
jgi:hypothetical protein